MFKEITLEIIKRLINEINDEKNKKIINKYIFDPLVEEISLRIYPYIIIVFLMYILILILIILILIILIYNKYKNI